MSVWRRRGRRTSSGNIGDLPVYSDTFIINSRANPCFYSRPQGRVSTIEYNGLQVPQSSLNPRCIAINQSVQPLDSIRRGLRNVDLFHPKLVATAMSLDSPKSLSMFLSTHSLHRLAVRTLGETTFWVLRFGESKSHQKKEYDILANRMDLWQSVKTR